MTRALLVVTADGFGKRVPMRDLPPRRRGAKGVAVVAKPGAVPVVAAVVVDDRDELLIATRHAKLLRIPASGIRRAGRRSRGVRIVALRGGDEIANVVRVSPARADVEGT